MAAAAAAAAHPSPSEALWLACEQGDDAKARTVLAAARKAGSADALLLRRRHGLTLMHLAAERGHFRVLTELLASGAAADVVTAAGVTPLHLAAERGRNDAVDVLVAFGAEQPADAEGLSCLPPTKKSYVKNLDKSKKRLVQQRRNPKKFRL